MNMLNLNKRCRCGQERRPWHTNCAQCNNEYMRFYMAKRRSTAKRVSNKVAEPLNDETNEFNQDVPN